MQMLLARALEWQTVHRADRGQGRGRCLGLGKGKAEEALGRAGSRGRVGNQERTVQLGGLWRGLA